MPVYDFSSGFQAINQGIDGIGKLIQARREGEALVAGLDAWDRAQQGQQPQTIAGLAPVATGSTGAPARAAAPAAMSPWSTGHNDLVKSDVTYLTSKGLTPVQAAGIVGHGFAESGNNPTGAAGDSGRSNGYFQWDPQRFANMKAFAQSQGRDWRDRTTQLDFALVEAKADPRVWGALSSAKTPEEATTAWMHFERPQGYTPDNPTAGMHYDKRLAAARRSLDLAGGTATAEVTRGYNPGPRQDPQAPTSQFAQSAPLPPTRPIVQAGPDAPVAPVPQGVNPADVPAPNATEAVGSFFIPGETPVQTAPQQAPQVAPAPAPAPQQVAQAAPAYRQQPAPGSQPYQPPQFQVPAQQGMSPEQKTVIQSLLRNPGTRQAGLALWGQLREGNQAAATRLFEIQKLMEQRQYDQWKLQQEQGNKDRDFDLNRQRFDYERNKPMTASPDQDIVKPDGTVVRAGTPKPIVVDGVLVDPKTYQPLYTAPQKPVTVGGNLVNPTDGKVIYSAPDKPVQVGDSLVDPATGKPVYTAPEKPQPRNVQVINGRVVVTDPNTLQSTDTTPQGLPSGYRPLTPDEKKAYGIPENTGAVMGPDGKPQTLPGTASSKTTIETGNKPGLKYDETISETYAKTFLDLQKTARSAAGAKNTLRLMTRLTEDPNFYSGFGGERSLQANKFLSSIGIKDAKANAPNEVFAALGNDLVLNKLGGSLGAGVSNTDTQFLKDTVASLATTKEGNRLMLAYTERVMDRQQALGKLARDYAKANGGRIDPGFDDVLEQFAEENPLFTKQDFKDAQAAMNGSPAGQTALTTQGLKPGEKRETTVNGKTVIIQKLAN